MAKRITVAVAGSGKTTRIVRDIDPVNRTLILTYTTTNIANIRQKVSDRFDGIPANVKIQTLTSFLYASCFRPYMHDITKETGTSFKTPPRRGTNHHQLAYYLTPSRKVYTCRMLLALQTFGFEERLSRRIERFFDHVMIDEVQDLAGRDFDFLSILARSSVKVDLVGDFYQHTYDSSRDGPYNQSLHEDYNAYIRRILKMGYVFHPEQLTKSYRCSPSVCDFVSNQLGIQITSHQSEQTDVKLVASADEAHQIMADDSIVKLFYQQHYAYNCFSKNWGESKGEDCYGDVCVVLNGSSSEAYASNNLAGLPPSTRNKLYVAITRAKRHVYLMPQSLLGRRQ